MNGELRCSGLEKTKKLPSLDQWIREAKRDPRSGECGMYLFHNGVVRETAKARVRQGKTDTRPVRALEFSYEESKAEAAIAKAYEMPGIHYVRVWLNQGRLQVGDEIMLVLVGGDIRPHVVEALQSLVGELKNQCVQEREIFE